MSSNNITVNGKPLEEHLEQEAAAEIAEVQQVEIREKTWRPPAGRSKFGNTSGARTAPGEVIYTRQGRETHIIISGTMFPWAEKAPYVRSGESVLGAVEYDAKTDRIKCHECGEWEAHVGIHLKAHGDNAKAYRLRHGLNIGSPLCGPGRSRALEILALQHQAPARKVAKLVEEKIASGLDLVAARRTAAQEFSASYSWAAKQHKRLLHGEFSQATFPGAAIAKRVEEMLASAADITAARRAVAQEFSASYRYVAEQHKKLRQVRAKNDAIRGRRGPQSGRRQAPHRYYERDNLRAQCRAQLSERISALCARLGRRPYQSELISEQIRPEAIRRVFGMTLSKVFDLLKLPPRERRLVGQRRFSDDDLISALRRRADELGHPPSRRELKGCSPEYNVFLRRLGGLPQARFLAGLDGFPAAGVAA
jgi:hypothetical protein